MPGVAQIPFAPHYALSHQLLLGSARARQGAQEPHRASCRVPTTAKCLWSGTCQLLPPHRAVQASRSCSPIPRAPATDFLFRRGKDFREQRARPPPPEAFFVTCPGHCRFCKFRHEQESTEPWQSSQVQQPHVPAAQGKQQGLGQGSRAEPAQLWVLGASAVTCGLLALTLLMLLARQERRGASRAQTQVSLPPPVWHLSLIRIIIGLLQTGLLGLLARAAHQPDKSA